ncbi:hypothetical protein QQZ08_007418 [Neonectria magnoliae]|uniref:Uncharacterized protein n=1 Tax=Neonectria magnoliae TaxID=2732573 RepID=A0ABR1HZL7_9HYPO
MSTVLLLQGVCMTLLQKLPEYNLYDWSILHKMFHISQTDPEDNRTETKILTARTDGCLQARHRGQGPDKGDVLAIIEVKLYRRFRPKANTAPIRIQEGAEMAAWISTEARKGLFPPRSDKTIYRRLLISQDFNQVFLTIAEFDESYIRCISGDEGGWSRAAATPDILATPSKHPRLDLRSGMSSSPPDTDNRGRPQRRDEKKDKKSSSIFSFKSSSGPSSSSKSIPSASDPPRHRFRSAVPCTLSGKAGPKLFIQAQSSVSASHPEEVCFRVPGAPLAPRQSTYQANEVGGGRGAF